MPRFVLLEHDHPFRHWDFMLETSDVLRCWRLLAFPSSGEKIKAEPLGEHRVLYLDYEGPVSGNRGKVVRCDAGTYRWHVDESNQVAVALCGSHLRGLAILTKLREMEWEFILKD
jgi:hypothetical protein